MAKARKIKARITRPGFPDGAQGEEVELTPARYRHLNEDLQGAAVPAEDPYIPIQEGGGISHPEPQGEDEDEKPKRSRRGKSFDKDEAGSQDEGSDEDEDEGSEE